MVTLNGLTTLFDRSEGLAAAVLLGRNNVIFLHENIFHFSEEKNARFRRCVSNRIPSTIRMKSRDRIHFK
jgi:hypothetical protein